MVIVGIDAHKRSHTAVAVDASGRRLGQRTIGTTSEEHLALLGWAEQFGPQRSWAIEDCRHLSRRLEADNFTPRFIGSPSPKPTTTNPLVSCSIAAARAATTKPNHFASSSADYQTSSIEPCYRTPSTPQALFLSPRS